VSVARPLDHPDDTDAGTTGGWPSMVAWVGVLVSLVVAPMCAWSLTVERTASSTVVEVVEVTPIIGLGAGRGPSGAALRVSWVEADGRRRSHPVLSGTEIQPGDRLTVTRSDLVDDVVRIEWESGRLDFSPIGRRTAVAGLVAALIVGTTAGVTIVRRRR
jgi:hypothetical protein